MASKKRLKPLGRLKKQKNKTGRVKKTTKRTGKKSQSRHPKNAVPKTKQLSNKQAQMFVFYLHMRP